MWQSNATHMASLKPLGFPAPLLAHRLIGLPFPEARMLVRLHWSSIKLSRALKLAGSEPSGCEATSACWAAAVAVGCSWEAACRNSRTASVQHLQSHRSSSVRISQTWLFSHTTAKHCFSMPWLILYYMMLYINTSQTPVKRMTIHRAEDMQQ